MAVLLNFTVSLLSKSNSMPGQSKLLTPPTKPLRNSFPLWTICTSNLVLDQAFVGKAKDRLDIVGSNLTISDVVPVFGPYVKFLCKKNDGDVALEATVGKYACKLHSKLCS